MKTIVILFILGFSSTLLLEYLKKKTNKVKNKTLINV
jgi:hypothetical protein